VYLHDVRLFRNLHSDILIKKIQVMKKITENRKKTMIVRNPKKSAKVDRRKQ